MYQLPTFKGWTVDIRLKEFRKVDKRGMLETVGFDSENGYRLLKEYRDTAPIYIIRFTSEELDWLDRALDKIPWYDWEARMLGKIIGAKLVQSVQEVIDNLC